MSEERYSSAIEKDKSVTVCVQSTKCYVCRIPLMETWNLYPYCEYRQSKQVANSNGNGLEMMDEASHIIYVAQHCPLEER